VACEKWHFYLYGRRFTLVTDHQALKTLLVTGGTRHRPLRLHRWADRLYQCSFDVEFRPRKLNVVADCFSRTWEDQPEMTSSASPKNDTEVDDLRLMFGKLATADVSLQAVAEATDNEETLASVCRLVIGGWPASKSALQAELWPYYRVETSYRSFTKATSSPEDAGL
jgi:RNase H-like domain found in reverse transcriptase